MDNYWFYKWLEAEKLTEAENWKDIARLATLKLQLAMQDLRNSFKGIDLS